MRSICRLFLLVSMLSACAGDRQTVLTNPATPTAPATPPSPVASKAVLEISKLAVEEVLPTSAQDPWFYYEIRFQLRETGRQSGATIQDVTSTLDDRSSDVMGASCWRIPIKVEPGGTLDTFDAGWNGLGRCAPGVESRSASSHVAVAVSFTDDEGHTGSVEATTPVAK